MDSLLSESLFSDGLIKELQNQFSTAQHRAGLFLHRCLPGAAEQPLLLPSPWECQGMYTKGTEESANNSAPPSSL